MIEIVIHQSSGNAGWYIRQADGSITREGYVLGDNPNAYTAVTYQAAIDALDGVPLSESIVFSSPQSNTLARKRKQKDQTQVYLDFQRRISSRIVRFNPIDADCERANYAQRKCGQFTISQSMTIVIRPNAKSDSPSVITRYSPALNDKSIK